MARLIDIGGGVVIDRDEQLRELDRADCEDSLYLFLRAAWKNMDPSPWVDGWPIEAIAEHLEAVVDGDIRRLIINIPPRSGKSNIAAVAFPAWCWAQHERSPTSGAGVRFLFASYAERLSLRDSIKCRRLMRSPWYQSMWARRFQLNRDQDTAHRFGNDQGGERLITSIGGTATGEGADIFLIDDPNAANEAFSEATIQATIEWWDQTASTRLNDPKTGAYIIVQQRLAEDDLSGHILERDIGDWSLLCLPMHYDPDRVIPTAIGWTDPRKTRGELLWPERFGEREVKELERTLGPFASAGQLEQLPQPAGGGAIRDDWWRVWEESAFPPMDFILAALDTAYTEKTENDYSAITVWGVYTVDTVAHPGRVIDRDGRPIMDPARSFAEPAPKVMLMSAWQERLPLHELVNKVAETCKRLKVDKLLIENKAAGISVAQEIRRLYGSEEFATQLHDPRSTDKLSRLYSVQHLFAEGLIHVPGTPDANGIVNLRSWAEMVIKQVSQFPRGKHDDLVDTVSMALRHLRDLGMLVRPPERLAEIERARQYEHPLQPLYPV